MAKYGKNINKEEFEKLCQIQANEDEITWWFSVSPQTLSRWCKQEYGMTYVEAREKFRGLGRIALRRIQWEHAKKNATMAIWLGKQYLGQKDFIEQTNDNKIIVQADVPKEEEPKADDKERVQD